MQSSKVRSLFNLTTVNGTILRSVTVNSASINATEESQLKPWQVIPGPSSLPFIGQLHHFLPGGSLSDTTNFQDNLYKLYGPIVRLNGMFGQAPMLFIYDPESCAVILRGENWMPRRPGFESLQYYRQFYNKTKEQSLKPTGMLTDDGDNWKMFRSTVNHVMMQPKTVKLYSGVLEEVSEDMVKRIKSVRNKNNKLETQFDNEMNLWALESIGVVALGGRINCFDPNLTEDSPAKRLIKCIHQLFEVANQLDFQPSLWRYYPTRKFKMAMKLYEEQESIAKYFVRQAMAELKTKDKNCDDQKGVLEKLLEIDEEIAVIMASDMLFAGVDTTSNTITTTLYYLAKNQEKQNKLREEIKSGNQRYVKACLKESLRMLPTISGNLRQLNRDYNIMGYKIPKDMLVSFPHQFFSSWESQFPRSKEFIPERWLDKESPVYHGQAHPFAYSPFGFGVRSCIGRRIAELEMETFLSKLIQNFRVEWDGQKPKVAMKSITYITGPFHFIFKDV